MQDRGHENQLFLWSHLLNFDDLVEFLAQIMYKANVQKCPL